MQWLAEVCVRRPVFATVLMLFITVVGWASYFKLSVDRFPKIDFPIVTVVTRLDGAAPEEVETDVTDKIEEAVNTISGIDELRSISVEGVSQVFVSFVLEKDINVAAQEVRDKVASAMPQLPRGIDAPIIAKVDPDASPILLVSLTSEHSIRETTELADRKIRQQIENISGVGQVTIIGGQKRQVHVLLDPVRLRAAGITPGEVQRAIMTQNASIPGGSLDTGPQRLTLRVRGRVESAEELGNLVVRQTAGHSIRVRDVGRVEDGEEEAETAASRDGRPTVLLSVRKQSGENTVDTVDRIRQRIKEVNKSLPPGYSLDVIRDNSETTRTAVEAVKEHLALGAVFAALIVLLFLGNLRSTVIAAVAIPISIVGTFALMGWQDFTLNTITLLALALAVGIVIDDAIVVLENIYTWVEDKKVPPMQAAVEATKEIGLAVLATTLSLMAVFLPVAFLGGVPGRFLKGFGITMAFSIGVSLFVSFSLTPMLSSRWLKLGGHTKKNILEKVVDWFYMPVERLYVRVLRWVMAHRWVIVIASVATLGSCIPLGKRVPKGFIPKSDEAQMQIAVRAPEGTSLEATKLVGERIAREVRQLPEVRLTVVTIGDNNEKTPNLASIYVKLVPPDRRKNTQDELEEKIRHEIISKQPKDYRITVSDVPAFSTGSSQVGAQVMYSLTGPDLDGLSSYTNEIIKSLKAVPGAVDADSTLVVGKPEIAMSVDRAKAADMGVSVADVADALRLLVGGLKVSTFEESGRQYDIRVRADRDYRSSIEALSLLTVPSARLGTVPLLDVVKLAHAEGPSGINRYNRQRQVMVQCNTAPGYGAGQIGDELEKRVKQMKLPATYQFAPTGQSREIGRTMRNFAIAFGLSFVFMYMILAAQFESWLHPITILLSLPLTVPFALISILLFKQTIDIFTMLGILVLFGVVKKNAILQIDHTNQLREKGMPRAEAIIAGNRDRLRPILMTTFAFVAGMIPLVFSTGIGSGFNRATSGVVVGGQTLSLLLTLLATPVAYSYFDDLSQWFARKRGGGKRSTEENTVVTMTVE